jgi:hypothetical protein
MLAAIEFDTLSYANELKKVGFTGKQAEVQAKALKRIIDSNLATKQDILMLQKEIAETKGDLQKEIAETKSDLQKDIEKNAHAAKQDILMLQKEIVETRGDLQKEIAETRGGIIKWVAGMLLAQSAVIATLVKLL